MRVWGLLLMGWALGLGVATAQSTSANRLQVVTSIAPLYCWAVNVAGDRADVASLLPPNVGPHDFQFRPRDIRRVERANLVFLNGLGLESWFSRVFQNRKIPVRIVEAAAGLSTNQMIHGVPELEIGGRKEDHDHDHDHDGHGHGDGHGSGARAGAPNPHLWLDPLLACHAVSNLVTALGELDRANADYFAERGRAYVARLRALDEELRRGIGALKSRDIVTFHDAFPYFCRRYDLHLVGVIEEVPGTSPSPRYLSELSAAIRRDKVSALFVEPQFDVKLARQLAKDLSIGVATLDTLETGRLTPEAYEEGMRANLRALQGALR
ncbi:MAG: metal ABC transporter substrate-binding protein [Verrucomicrobiota bacterium]